MLAEGNSSVMACSRALLSSMQREIPFARSKGIDPDVYDMAFDETPSYLDEYARDVLGAYEKRIDVEAVELEYGEGPGADGASYTVSVVESSLEDDNEDDYGDD